MDIIDRWEMVNQNLFWLILKKHALKIAKWSEMLYGVRQEWNKKIYFMDRLLNPYLLFYLRKKDLQMTLNLMQK